jgi:hypothetical protein
LACSSEEEEPIAVDSIWLGVLGFGPRGRSALNLVLALGFVMVVNPMLDQVLSMIWFVMVVKIECKHR